MLRFDYIIHIYAIIPVQKTEEGVIVLMIIIINVMISSYYYNYYIQILYNVEKFW